MKYIRTKDGKIIDLSYYELDEETEDRYYFSDKKFGASGIIIKKVDVDEIH